jgi:hypothetical protein
MRLLRADLCVLSANDDFDGRMCLVARERQVTRVLKVTGLDAI